MDPPDITLRRLAERYAAETEVRSEVDRALGVFHVPPHPKGECGGCDRARKKGLVTE